jgi:hypothetical protein
VRTSSPDRAKEILSALPGVREVTPVEDGAFRVLGVEAPQVARALVRAGIDLQALIPADEDLETRFLRLTGGER